MIIYSGVELFSWARNPLKMLEKKIITVTSESQLAAQIALQAFLHASYPEARSMVQC